MLELEATLDYTIPIMLHGKSPVVKLSLDIATYYNPQFMIVISILKVMINPVTNLHLI